MTRPRDVRRSFGPSSECRMGRQLFARTYRIGVIVYERNLY